MRSVGYRSGSEAARLRRDGLDARNLRGGILEWCHAGQPVVNAGGPTRRVHVYGARWNFLPEGYEPVAIIAVGYPGDPALLSDRLRAREVQPRVRKPLTKLVYSTTWEQPSPLFR